MTTPSAPDAAAFAEAAKAHLDELVALRRAIHADPELGTDLPRTQRRVLDALKDLPLTVHVGENLRSVVAVLRGGRPGPVVLLRGDMDALPLHEETGLPFASPEQRMHACGHDLHTAGLVGAAHLLAHWQEHLPGTVVFMFQPGEETLEGALGMLKEGLLDIAGERPVAAYALHVAPGPRGLFMLSAGPSAAGSSRLTITLTGPGGHASRPHETVDLVPILAEITIALQTMLTRQIDTQEPAVITLTQLSAGDAFNVMPSRVSAAGTFRYLTLETKDALATRIRKIATGIAETYGAGVEVVIDHGCPPLSNDHDLTAQSTRVLRDLFGEQRVVRASDSAAVMGAEDFAFISQEVPSSYFRLFTTPADVDVRHAAPNHSPGAVFDDSLLADHAAALAALAWDRLALG